MPVSEFSNPPILKMLKTEAILTVNWVPGDRYVAAMLEMNGGRHRHSTIVARHCNGKLWVQMRNYNKRKPLTGALANVSEIYAMIRNRGDIDGSWQ